MYKANGKLLLTSEYYVLDGALSLALPVQLGQTLKINQTSEKQLIWESYTKDNNCWFTATYNLPGLTITNTSDNQIATTLQQILQTVDHKQPDLLLESTGFHCATYLDFPRDWGLGTSSTLMWLLAKWAGINPFDLLFETMGGSGYDIACAGAEGPLFYQLQKAKQPIVTATSFSPPFQQNLYFVYLGKKQNSRDGIKHYRTITSSKSAIIEELSTLTKELVVCETLERFNELITTHELIISKNLKLPMVKQQYFDDFPGAIKSLGAWGGDFVLASSEMPPEKVRSYFNERGFEVFFKYDELILNAVKK